MKLGPGCPPVMPMVILLSALALWPTLTLAQSIADDRAALQGIKEVKVAFVADQANTLLARPSELTRADGPNQSRERRTPCSGHDPLGFWR